MSAGRGRVLAKDGLDDYGDELIIPSYSPTVYIITTHHHLDSSGSYEPTEEILAGAHHGLGSRQAQRKMVCWFKSF
jgi:hypothetical protein